MLAYVTFVPLNIHRLASSRVRRIELKTDLTQKSRQICRGKKGCMVQRGQRL